MHKGILLVIVSIIVTGCIRGPLWDVEQVHTWVNNEPHYWGNAFPVSYDKGGTILITAAHVVDDCDRLAVKTDSNSASPVMVDAKILHINKDADIATIRVDGKIDHVYSVCKAYPGEEIVIPSRHYGSWRQSKTTGYRLTYGTVVAASDGFLMLDAAVIGGYSGSPVISRDRDCVVGVVVARLIGTTTSFAAEL